MVDKTRTGHRYPSYRYEVSRAKIEEYAAATGFPLPEPGATPAVAPHIFAACFTVMRGAALLREDDQLGGSGPIVHAGQEYDFHRRVASGDVLTCTPQITDITDRGAHTYLTLQISCVDEQDEPVVTSRQTIAYLGAAA
ncbi:FAS1-like dehydratase domain-containing protein [Petropleomorpha daqingensis]|uniref:Acyl dehydratase n=1 Tax=Petropleomorpha daqingensis TaxID=2026353 RepID=A0A853C7Q7_9ACTN|nr:acyl dehydratase [Petropleomorpha daqingensis]